jgi:hypothetical protein
MPRRVIEDQAFACNELGKRLAERDIGMIVPHRRKWKIKQLFAWLGKERLVMRYERHAEDFFSFVQLSFLIILLRDLL